MKQLIIRLVYMFEVILVALWASVAQAQLDSNQTYPDYKTPGVCPYAGNPEWAGKNLQPKTGLPYEQFMVGVAKWKAGQCEEYFVQDGEIIGTTSTCPGQGHKVSVVRVAFGDDISPKDPIRRGLSCDVGNSHGLQPLLLDACGNWSVHQMVKPPPEKPKPVIWKETTQSTALSGMQMITRSANFPRCCNDCLSGSSFVLDPAVKLKLSGGLKANAVTRTIKQ